MKNFLQISLNIARTYETQYVLRISEHLNIIHKTGNNLVEI